MIEDTDLKLGKAPPKRYYADVKIKLADYLDTHVLPAPPRSLPPIGKGVTFNMYLNDNLGDCTCAAVGHKEQIDSARTGAKDAPTDDIIRELYHKTGIEQGLTDTDGRYMEGVLKHLKETGLRQTAGDPDNPEGSYEKILGYAAVNWKDDLEYKTALWLFGGIYNGIALPEIAYYQLKAGKGWSLDTSYGGSSAPGSWGGHAVYTTTGGTLITWAQRQNFSLAFRHTYFDECYAVLTEDWVQNTKAPNGFNRDELVADLAAV